MTGDLNAPMFTNEDAAREALEAVRWPDGPVCPHCGSTGDDLARVQGKSGRPGLFYCNGCKGQFTVTVGTVFERSKIPLTKWWMACHLLNSSKKGISAHQMHRMLGVTYKSAWFMMHRLREAMRTGGLEPLGGAGKVVQADETYYGKTEDQRVSPQRKGRPYIHGPKRQNRPIVALVERGGSVRTFHVPVADAANVAAVVRDNVHRESRLHTDESRLYRKVGAEFAAHETVQHTANEYVRGDVTTNHVENYFSVFKRGMRGVYQHCGEKHLHRYLAEFDFRHNNRSALGVTDGERAALAMKGIEGKRLTYRPTH
jgi:transposase-like protein